MENIDSDLLLNYYFKDGYMFSCPSRLIWNTIPSLFNDRDFGFAPDFDEALEISLDDSESLESTDL